MIGLKKFLMETRFYLLNLISDHAGSALFLLSFIRRVFFVFFYCFRVSRDTTVRTDASKSLSSSPLDSETEELQKSDMVELENPVNDDDDQEEEEEETKEESPRLVFKFSYQTETFERLSREGYRGGDGDGLASTADKYETFPAKNLSFVAKEPNSAAFSVEESFSVNMAGEDNGFLQEKLIDGETEESVSGNDMTEDSVSADKKNPENLVAGESLDFPEKIRFLVENDFLESTDSDSGMMDSSQTFTSYSEGFLSDSDSDEYFGSGTTPEKDSMENSESRNNGKNQEEDSDSEEDSNGLESLWEHQDLIEQLQMEMKKVKAFGLPTIREDEDECPNIVEDLKPWKIEEKKFRHADTIGELHKFYKSYKERMRKFDILSYQKMYALGLLQSKDPLRAISAVGTSSSPTFSSVFPVSLRLWKQNKPETTDPMVKFIREIHGELENVYVGQMCLSWEILHWQYEKAIELWESDAYGARRYNEIAGEFQQFQVLVQRFMEDEAFECPRIQHYAKKRCVIRNLLQVPVIREDGNKDRRKGGRRRDSDDENAITSEQLVEIMEESIRVFWRFVQSDKRTSSIKQKRTTRSKIEPEEDPEGLDMFSEIKSNLQKKEKRLKEVLKSGNCIIRRLKKKKRRQEEEEEEEEEQALHFFSQVDMKLVTRVLNMSNLTKDHLVWCHDKLTNINFVNRKIHLDPSFCLFPS